VVKFDPTRKYIPTTKMMFLSNHGHMKSSGILGSKSKSRSITASPVRTSPSNKLSYSDLKIFKASKGWTKLEDPQTVIDSSEDLLDQLSSIQETLSMRTSLPAPTEHIHRSIASDNIKEPIMAKLSGHNKRRYHLLDVVDRGKEVWRGRIQGGEISAFNVRFLLIGGYNTNHLALPFFMQMNGRIKMNVLGSYLPQMTATTHKNVSLCEIHPLEMSDYNGYNLFCNHYKDIRRGAVFDQTKNLGWQVYILPADATGIEEDIYLDAFSCTPTPGIMSSLVCQYTDWTPPIKKPSTNQSNATVDLLDAMAELEQEQHLLDMLKKLSS